MRTFKDKTCAVCGGWFTPTSPNQKYCSSCRREKILEQKRKYYEENREKALEWQRKYREENPEKIAEGKRKYREENPEKIAEGKRKHYHEKQQSKNFFRALAMAGAIGE